MPEVATENLVWRCTTCKKDYPPTSSIYASLIRQNEHKNHQIRLVDKTTGEVLAKSLQEALKKELIEKKVESGEEGVEFTEQGDTLIPMKVLLPASMLTLFFYAKTNELSDHANVIEFMVEYTQYGFMKAHNLGLTLAPVESAPQSGDGALIEEFRKLSEKLDKAIEGKPEKVSKEE